MNRKAAQRRSRWYGYYDRNALGGGQVNCPSRHEKKAPGVCVAGSFTRGGLVFWTRTNGLLAHDFTPLIGCPQYSMGARGLSSMNAGLAFFGLSFLLKAGSIDDRPLMGSFSD